MSERHRITRDGVTLSAMITGRPGAPAILLSNSLGATVNMWAPQRALLEPHYRVIGYDTRGHGHSDTPQGVYSLDDLVADALAVLDHFEVAQADIMGLSLGGMTGLGLGLDHADRVGRVICACARADAPPPFATSWDDRIAAIETGGMAAIWPGTLERWLTPGFTKCQDAAVAALHADFLQTTVPGYTGCARALQGLDYRKRLPQMAVPVLYVSGADDLGAAPEVMQDMHAATPGSSYKSIPACAHIANLNQPDSFNHTVMTFLGL